MNTYILSWSSTTSARGWRVADFSIRAFGMFLLHVRVKSGIREVGFIAIFALVVPPLHVILGPSLSFALVVWVVRVIIVIERVSSFS